MCNLPNYLQNILSWRPQIFSNNKEKLTADLFLSKNDESTKQLAHKLLMPIGPGYRQVIWSMMNIMQDRITRHRLSIDQPDIELRPDLGHLALMHFHLAESSIEEGRQAVKRQARAITLLYQS
jgi:predicted acylesterase/phospholipase RssA